MAGVRHHRLCMVKRKRSSKLSLHDISCVFRSKPPDRSWRHRKWLMSGTTACGHSRPKRHLASDKASPWPAQRPFVQELEEPVSNTTSCGQLVQKGSLKSTGLSRRDELLSPCPAPKQLWAPLPPNCWESQQLQRTIRAAIAANYKSCSCVSALIQCCWMWHMASK